MRKFIWNRGSKTCRLNNKSSLRNNNRQTKLLHHQLLLNLKDKLEKQATHQLEHRHQVLLHLLHVFHLLYLLLPSVIMQNMYHASSSSTPHSSRPSTLRSITNMTPPLLNSTQMIATKIFSFTSHKILMNARKDTPYLPPTTHINHVPKFNATTSIPPFLTSPTSFSSPLNSPPTRNFHFQPTFPPLHQQCQSTPPSQTTNAWSWPISKSIGDIHHHYWYITHPLSARARPPQLIDQYFNYQQYVHQSHVTITEEYFTCSWWSGWRPPGNQDFGLCNPWYYRKTSRLRRGSCQWQP